MNHIFISYSRHDERIVDAFVRKMREIGYPVWLDRSGAASGIPFSTKWMDVIVEALYTAQGAIIFRSPEWEKSVPCQKEYDLIRKCDMPYIEITPTEAVENTRESFARLRNFYDTELKDRNNLVRTALFSNSYAYKNGVDPYQLLNYTRAAQVRKILKYLLLDIRRYNKLAEERNYEQLNPDIYPAMQGYLKFAKKAAIRSLAAVSIGLVLTLVMVVVVNTYAEALPVVIDDTKAIFDDMAYAGDIKSISENDPVKAIRLAEEFKAEDVEKTNYVLLNHNTVELEHHCLPDKVLIKASEADIAGYGLDRENLTSEKYSVKLSDTGSLIITDSRTGISDTVNIPASADGYAWNETGDKLVIWCNTRVFIYHPQGEGLPVELDESYRYIEKAAVKTLDGKTVIAALNDCGSLLVWNDPIADQVNNRTDVSFARFIDRGDQSAAVYISNNKIIVNKDNKEHVLEADLAGKLSNEGFAVSHDSSRIAVVHIDGSNRIGIVDLGNGTVTRDVEMPYKPQCLTFSRDDRYVFAAASGCGLMRLDVSTGEVVCGNDSYYLHNVALYGDDLVASDYIGKVIIYNQELEPQGGFVSALDAAVPFQDLAIAEAHGMLFGVNRGGGESIGCDRYDLKTGELYPFIVSKTDKVAANTAVAVSPNEELVAYGYPDGIVRVYETNQMFIDREFHSIGEAVSALKFASEGSEGSESNEGSGENMRIYALGRSGTIYSIDFTVGRPNLSLETMRANWKNLQSRLTDKRQKYEDGLQ